jgi:hypothetical protein
MEVQKFTRSISLREIEWDGSVTRRLGRAEHDSGMKESAGNARGDSDQIRLTDEGFDLRGAREVRQVDGAPSPDARGSGIVDRDRRELWQEFARVDEKIRSCCRRLLPLREGPGEILCCARLPCSLRCCDG